MAGVSLSTDDREETGARFTVDTYDGEDLLIVINNASDVSDDFKEKMLNFEEVTAEDQVAFKQMFREMVLKGGRKRFLKLVKDELKDIPIDVEFNIAGKQAYQAEMVSKLNSVFRAVFANPAVLQSEGMAELFNNILESAGLSPVSFAGLTQAPAQPQQMPQAAPPAEPLAVAA